MKPAVRASLGVFLVWLTSIGCAAVSPPQAAVSETPAATAARSLDAVPSIEPGDFTRLTAMIKPRPGEAPFEQIPWLATVWEGRIQAASRGKPMVAFLMSGHPMGCT